VVTLREVTGDPEEVAALQRIFESNEDFALRVTGHPPGPADAQSTLMFVPEGRSPDDKAVFGVWAGDELVGVLDLLLRYPDDETVYLGLLLIDRDRQGQGVGAAACRALEGEVLPRWALGPAAPPQRGPDQRPGPRLLAPDGLRRDRRGPALALRQARVGGGPDGQGHSRPARRRSRTAWRSSGRGSVSSTRWPVAGWVKARRQAWRKGRPTPRRAARVGSAP
jgi:GNAT superfamily N-acetyltransferase